LLSGFLEKISEFFKRQKKNVSRGNRVSIHLPTLRDPNRRQQAGRQLRDFQVRRVETPTPCRGAKHQPTHA
jgi:hypothetical protein